MNLRPELSYDDGQVSTDELANRPHARALGLHDVLPLLISPDSGKALAFAEDEKALSDGDRSYPLRSGFPVLLPHRLLAHYTDRLTVPLADYSDDAFMQYFLLATIKQSGEINAQADDVHYKRHLHRLRNVVAEARGLVVDVGCDDAQIGASLFSTAVDYVGLDPFCTKGMPFRLIGLGEYLSIKDATADVVLFNTSLDHILDWRRAIDEAYRVLVPGGILYISTLAWTDKAGLVTDSVHFHHFREYEIFGALGSLRIEDVRRYDYKGNQYRHGLYVTARKPL